ncbi:MAG: hypothetical protein GF334_12660, partial [Candidatus Altiarchaeales archaeon]|nr:hypothetical protein [Candidatus Altiarchaeales archaeon]
MKRKSEKIPGGMAEGKKPSDFDARQMAMGIKVEMEHTDNREIAKEIAMDHLMEDPKYYTHLLRMEKKYEKKASAKRVLRKKLIRIAMENPKMAQRALLLLRRDYG